MFITNSFLNQQLLSLFFVFCLLILSSEAALAQSPVIYTEAEIAKILEKHMENCIQSVETDSVRVANSSPIEVRPLGSDYYGLKTEVTFSSFPSGGDTTYRYEYVYYFDRTTSRISIVKQNETELPIREQETWQPKQEPPLREIGGHGWWQDSHF